MNKDIRLSIDFWDHAKTLKLIRVLGLQGAVSLQKLWCYAAKYRPEGMLFKMDPFDIKAVSGWPKKAEKFVETLLDLQWIHRDDDGIFILHQWEEYNPWVATIKKRVERAKKGAMARWGSGNAPSTNKQCLSDAPSTNKQCPEHMLNGCLGDAPSPTPSPTPKAVKKILSASDDAARSNGGRFFMSKKKRRLTGQGLEDFDRFWEAFNYKRGKAEAADSWLDLGQLMGYSMNFEMVGAIVKGAQREAAARPDIIAKGLSPKMASGWLASRRWEDEAVEDWVTRKERELAASGNEVVH